MSGETRGYSLVREGEEDILLIDATSWSFSPSLEQEATVMGMTIDALVENPGIKRLRFRQRKNFDYSYDQVQLLADIAGLYQYFIKGKRILSLDVLGMGEVPDAVNSFIAMKRGSLQNLLSLLRTDPIGCWVETRRLMREEKIALDKESNLDLITVRENFFGLLQHMFQLLDATNLISLVRDRLDGHSLGDRDVYRNIFHASITPDFMYARLLTSFPLDGEQKDLYTVPDATVTLFRVPHDIKLLYHVSPIEFGLSEDEYMLLDLARNVMREHKPREEEFLEPARMRRTFFQIGKDLLQELADHRGVDLPYTRLDLLARILVRYTVGFGLLEVLMQDQKVQDIVINSPVGGSPIFVVHQEYGECVTNITPSREDADGWATKFRLLSGRPLDEANPVLDTELVVPGARGRVAVMTTPLSPTGLAYAIRRHRDKPWTLPLFIDNRMINHLGAGLLSFLIDGARTLLIAGTRSSGKTSLLGSLMVEIMRKYRIVTIEDSVTGDSEILIRKNGVISRTTIGQLIDSALEKYGCWYNLSYHEILGNDEGVEILAKDCAHRLIWKKPSKLIRHKVNKQLYEIVTRKGRTLKVTEDHSLFTLNDQAEVAQVKPKDLKKGSPVVTIRSLPYNEKDTLYFNILDHLDKVPSGFFCGYSLREFIREHFDLIKQLAKERGYNKQAPRLWLRNGVLPTLIVKDLKSFGKFFSYSPDLSFKISGNSGSVPVRILLDDDFVTLLGVWIADGCYDHNSIIFSTFDVEDRALVRRVAFQFGITPRVHSDGGSLMVNSTTLKYVFRELFELRGNAYTKRIPSWMFNLSKNQLSSLLRGIFTGDGCPSNYEIVIPLASRQLLSDLQTLLLAFNIQLYIGNKRKDGTYNASISTLMNVRHFIEHIGFLQERQKKKLLHLNSRTYTHDITDNLPLTLECKRRLASLIKNDALFSTNDYVTRNNHPGIRKLQQTFAQLSFSHPLLMNVASLIRSDLYFDQIVDIKPLPSEKTYVYDLSVPDCENFVCNNILVHNTLEMPVDYLRSLGYNIQHMKVRSALTSGGVEVSADEGIRTSLRLGDSSLIVGEVRSQEAKALYEAMRVGALANVVAGTIHGASTYGVYDRVVNDLGVPKTSFKATDIIVVANPIRSPDGLRSYKRVLQIAEVRKHLHDDPEKEGGFVDLMSYDSKTDTLVPTPYLLNGESEVLKSIASHVKEWAGDWDALWENIALRGRIRERLLQVSHDTGMRELLEAEFIVRSNDTFHLLSDQITEEIGSLDTKRLYSYWDSWLQREVTRRRV